MIHFAHSGVEHADTLEKATHSFPWPVVITVVAIIALVGVGFILSRNSKDKE